MFWNLFRKKKEQHQPLVYIVIHRDGVDCTPPELIHDEELVVDACECDKKLMLQHPGLDLLETLKDMKPWDKIVVTAETEDGEITDAMIVWRVPLPLIDKTSTVRYNSLYFSGMRYGEKEYVLRTKELSHGTRQQDRHLGLEWPKVVPRPNDGRWSDREESSNRRSSVYAGSDSTRSNEIDEDRIAPVPKIWQANRNVESCEDVPNQSNQSNQSSITGESNVDLKLRSIGRHGRSAHLPQPEGGRRILRGTHGDSVQQSGERRDLIDAQSTHRLSAESAAR